MSARSPPAAAALHRAKKEASDSFSDSLGAAFSAPFSPENSPQSSPRSRSNSAASYASYGPYGAPTPGDSIGSPRHKVMFPSVPFSPAATNRDRRSSSTNKIPPPSCCWSLLTWWTPAFSTQPECITPGVRRATRTFYFIAFLALIFFPLAVFISKLFNFDYHLAPPQSLSLMHKIHLIVFGFVASTLLLLLFTRRSVQPIKFESAPLLAAATLGSTSVVLWFYMWPAFRYVDFAQSQWWRIAFGVAYPLFQWPYLLRAWRLCVFFGSPSDEQEQIHALLGRPGEQGNFVAESSVPLNGDSSDLCGSIGVGGNIARRRLSMAWASWRHYITDGRLLFLLALLVLPYIGCVSYLIAVPPPSAASPTPVPVSSDSIYVANCSSTYWDLVFPQSPSQFFPPTSAWVNPMLHTEADPTSAAVYFKANSSFLRALCWSVIHLGEFAFFLTAWSKLSCVWPPLRGHIRSEMSVLASTSLILGLIQIWNAIPWAAIIFSIETNDIMVARCIFCLFMSTFRPVWRSFRHDAFPVLPASDSAYSLSGILSDSMCAAYFAEYCRSDREGALLLDFYVEVELWQVRARALQDAFDIDPDMFSVSDSPFAIESRSLHEHAAALYRRYLRPSTSQQVVPALNRSSSAADVASSNSILPKAAAPTAIVKLSQDERSILHLFIFREQFPQIASTPTVNTSVVASSIASTPMRSPFAFTPPGATLSYGLASSIKNQSPAPAPSRVSLVSPSPQGKRPVSPVSSSWMSDSSLLTSPAPGVRLQPYAAVNSASPQNPLDTSIVSAASQPSWSSSMSSSAILARLGSSVPLPAAIFDSAQAAAYLALESTVFPRFIKSDEFRRLVQTMDRHRLVQSRMVDSECVYPAIQADGLLGEDLY